MITLIIGHKVSGKTNRLIQLANEAVEKSNGNVVVIEKGAKLTYDVSHKARLIDIEQYNVSGFDAFYGFLSGICALSLIHISEPTRLSTTSRMPASA